MRTQREANYRRMPWKNGGGETIEMMVSPAGASFDTFDWRVSMAYVGEPGPFSLFPNIDRTLSVIDGHGLSLTLHGEELISINRQSEPFEFSGDLKVESTLVDGPIHDLNVMTRRHRYRHRVLRYPLASPTQLEWQGDAGIVVAIGNGINIQAEKHIVTLAQRDALGFSPDDPRVFTASPLDNVDLFLIEIWQLTAIETDALKRRLNPPNTDRRMHDRGPPE